MDAAAVAADTPAVTALDTTPPTYTVGGVTWTVLDHPADREIRALGTQLGLHALAIEDTVNAHQRSKLERYDDVLFVVLHTAEYDDAAEKVRFGELHVFVGPGYIVTIRHGASPDLTAIRHRLDLAEVGQQCSPLTILHALLDAVVDGYAPVIAGLENDIDEIEDQLFTQDPSVSQRIYELVREVIAFQRAAGPMVTMTRDLELGTVFLESPVAGAQPEPHTSDIPSAPAAASAGSSDDVEIRRQMRDVLDHAIAVSERALEFRQMLENALQVHATLVAQQQNEEMKKLSEVSVVQGEAAKKISSWAAIFLAPTLIAGIYGMNFQEMPELHWLFGYPFALALMVLAAVLLYRRFKKVDWL